jgi:hypothetical protein
MAVKLATPLSSKTFNRYNIGVGIAIALDDVADSGCDGAVKHGTIHDNGMDFPVFAAGIAIFRIIGKEFTGPTLTSEMKRDLI